MQVQNKSLSTGEIPIFLLTHKIAVGSKLNEKVEDLSKILIVKDTL